LRLFTTAWKAAALRFCLATELENFWSSAASQSAATWSGHRDINTVPLAACLAPQGTLSDHIMERG
jgi:hypothetical protein